MRSDDSVVLVGGGQLRFLRHNNVTIRDSTWLQIGRDKASSGGGDGSTTGRGHRLRNGGGEGG